MDSLFRKVRSAPNFRKPAKHSKLGEGWEVNREAVTEGVTFYLKYLGSTLLDELPLGESYGEGVSARAVQRIVDMAKTKNKKLTKVALNVSPTGIKVTGMDAKDVNLDITIYRISFCTADKTHDKVFAFIARNTINETMECHAYYCARQKVAQAVTLSVSQDFKLVKDIWENSQNGQKMQLKKKKNEQNQTEAAIKSHTTSSFVKHALSAPEILVDVIFDFRLMLLAIIILLCIPACMVPKPMTGGTNEEDNAAANYSNHEMQAAEALIELAHPGYLSEPNHPNLPAAIQSSMYSVTLLFLMVLMTCGCYMVTNGIYVEDNAATSDSDDQILAAQALIELRYRRETRSQNQASDRVNIDEGEEHSNDLEED